MAGSTSGQQAGEVCELRMELLHLDPSIWREVAVPASMSLSKLHRVIQVVMGWDDAHLHEFVTSDGTRYERKSRVVESDPEAKDERRKKVGDLFPDEDTPVVYVYDFGDDWRLRLSLLRRTQPEHGRQYPRCLAGEYAGPPEDCGGPAGYVDLLEVLANPEDPEHDDRWDWVGYDFDPTAFSPDALNPALAKLK